MNRRDFLRAAGLAGTTGLSGCLLGPPDRSGLPPAGSPDDGPAPEPGSSRTATATATATATPTAVEDTPPSTATPTATAPDTDTDTTTATATATQTATDTAATGPQESVTVVVGEDGAFYAPQEFTLAVGGTVEWVWRGNGHNVIVDEKPAGADWAGTEGPATVLYDAGHVHTHSFEIPGEYEYHCYRHRVYGMVGAFSVVE
jgi:plastocyanin